jgi:hypothetical protein
MRGDRRDAEGQPVGRGLVNCIDADVAAGAGLSQ